MRSRLQDLSASIRSRLQDLSCSIGDFIGALCAFRGICRKAGWKLLSSCATATWKYLLICLAAGSGFLERCFTVKSVLSITVLLLVASWAYPPGYDRSDRSHGWFFLFDTSSDMKVDFGRLILLDAIIAAIGGWLAFVCRGERARSIVARVALYSLIAIPIVAIVWSVVAHIGYVMWQADQQHARDAPPATLTDSDFMPAFDPDKFLNAPPAPVRRKPAFDPTKPWEADPIVNDSDGAPPPGFVLDSDVRKSEAKADKDAGKPKK